MNNQHGIVLFDGVCNVCNTFVQFILQRDKKGYFHFASLQSDIGQEYLVKHNLPTKELTSVVLIKDDKFYTKSTAALHILKKLDGLWFLLFAFIVVPRFLRDFCYNIVAKYRYQWFGKKDACMIPEKGWMERFL